MLRRLRDLLGRVLWRRRRKRERRHYSLYYATNPDGTRLLLLQLPSGRRWWIPLTTTGEAARRGSPN